MTRCCCPPLLRSPELSSKHASDLSALNYRLRLARRLTFLVCPRKVSKRRAPDIRPGTTLRYVPGSFPPSVLQGSAYKGRPWPFTPFAASMPLNPLRTDSAHPSDGTPSPCLSETATSEMQSIGSRTLPISRPSRGAVQQVSRQDAEKAPMGHGWPFGACLRSSTGAREVERSETRMPGRVSFAYFALHKQTERSGVTAAGWPEGRVQRVKKVRRPAGRNQIFLINTKMKPCSTRCKWS